MVHRQCTALLAALRRSLLLGSSSRRSGAFSLTISLAEIDFWLFLSYNVKSPDRSHFSHRSMQNWICFVQTDLLLALETLGDQDTYTLMSYSRTEFRVVRLVAAIPFHPPRRIQSLFCRLHKLSLKPKNQAAIYHLQRLVQKVSFHDRL